MKVLILLLLIVLLWNISNAEECDCGTLIGPKPKDRKTRQIAQERTPQNTRIFKGSDVNADRYPWQIFLKIVATQQDFAIFGGSLISRKHILTASHPFHHPTTKM